MPDPQQVDFTVVQDFSSNGIPPETELVIYSGHAGPFMIIAENKFLDCPECHARYELTDYREGNVCRRIVEGDTCGGRMVRSGKPVESGFMKEITRAIRFERDGLPESDKLGSALWEKWFTSEGAEKRLRQLLEG